MAVAENSRPMEFAHLVRTNQGMVYSIAFHFVRDRSVAEDLAQDVFLQLHRNLKKLDSPEHVTHWLRRVTGHRCIDHVRQNSNCRQVALDSVPEPAAESTTSDPLLHEYMRKLVASLPEKKRLLVILRYQEEMEFEEIAKIVKMPARTVRTQLWRTLALLRDKAGRMLGEKQ